MKLCILQNLRVLISNLKLVFFSNSTIKHPNKKTLVPNLKFFLHETLQFIKFERTDFKHGNSLFKEVPAKNLYAFNFKVKLQEITKRNY